MKSSRISATIVATLALFAAGTAHADPAAATGGTTAVLSPYLKVWVNGDTLGPNRLGQKTGAGTMDAAFTWDQTAYATDKTKVQIATLFTRSNATPNGNNSYEQGGLALGTLSATAPPTLGAMVSLPNLNGDRPFMRPQVAFTDKYVIMIAASEDNNSNNGNPKPVAFLADKVTGALVAIKNSNRNNPLTKPTDLISLAQSQGINVPNANNQRGPHSIVAVPNQPNTFIVGMQYNNQASEAFSITVNPDASLKMNWLTRQSNNARHCRPQVAITPDGTAAYVTAVEANNQPAEIGFRLTKLDPATGKSLLSKIVVRSQPNNRLYVAEPVIGLTAQGIGIQYSMTSTNGKNGQNGHANVGAQVSNVALFNATDLTMIGTSVQGAAAFSRHAHLFSTVYGPDATPALATISGSSDGQKGGYIQYIPLTADGKLGSVDIGKMYQVAQYADVANVQARGKRNPNNQAKGFINGMGVVPNPGFDATGTAASNFMPETKCFSFATITGYTDATAANLGIKNSIWLSLTPAAWRNGLSTTPGAPTSTPGTNPDGTGPAPTTTSPGVDPSPNAQSGSNVIPDGPGVSPDDPNGGRAQLGADNGGCSVSHGSSSSGAGLLGLALAGVLVALRRSKREEA